MRLLGKREISEDALQETFLAVWKGARGFKGKSTVKTWLFKIAHKQAVNWIRRNIKDGLQREVPIQDSDIEKVLGEKNSLEDKVIGNWEIHQLGKALNHLTPNHRAVIELSFVHNFSYSEIAKIMGCPSGTIKSRMSYALRHLNRELIRMGLTNANDNS